MNADLLVYDWKKTSNQDMVQSIEAGPLADFDYDSYFQWLRVLEAGTTNTGRGDKAFVHQTKDSVSEMSDDDRDDEDNMGYSPIHGALDLVEKENQNQEIILKTEKAEEAAARISVTMVGESDDVNDHDEVLSQSDVNQIANVPNTVKEDDDESDEWRKDD